MYLYFHAALYSCYIMLLLIYWASIPACLGVCECLPPGFCLHAAIGRLRGDQMGLPFSFGWSHWSLVHASVWVPSGTFFGLCACASTSSSRTRFAAALPGGAGVLALVARALHVHCLIFSTLSADRTRLISSVGGMATLSYLIHILPHRYWIWSANISALKQIHNLYHEYPTDWTPFHPYLPPVQCSRTTFPGPPLYPFSSGTGIYLP